ncbi:MAG: NUDIX hydrolase [Candidatus Pacebacteria bacterium]|nr:NUDIX hydrolase [Candidatus Paceibacterota bacterium]NUQ56884.1 NUDIX hydrolase [Candidatus Paceibacter sp.]
MDPNKLFQISIKGLVFNDEGKVMLIKEKTGVWDLPGGRIEQGQNFKETLERECVEELGVKCEVLDKTPFFAWVAQNKTERWQAILCFRIKLESTDFKESDECVGHDFFDKNSLDSINLVPQTKNIKEWL